MTPEQSAAYVYAQAVSALATIEAMKAENEVKRAQGKQLLYTAADFMHVIDRYGLHHNAVISTFAGSGG